jgi:hypothetical protein
MFMAGIPVMPGGAGTFSVVSDSPLVFPLVFPYALSWVTFYQIRFNMTLSRINHTLSKIRIDIT